MKSCRIGAALLALVCLAACATNPTVPAADRLAHSAESFTTTACSSTDVCFDARYFTASERFTDQAWEFRETADTGSPLQILHSFEHLWREYHKLRYEVSRSGNETLETDFKHTTRAFRHVQQCVKQWYSDRDPLLLVRGGYACSPREGPNSIDRPFDMHAYVRMSLPPSADERQCTLLYCASSGTARRVPQLPLTLPQFGGRMLELYQFRFSHYCIKARWALEHKRIAYRERNLLPGAHIKVARALAKKSCLPILVCDGTVVQDSTEIISFLDQRFPENALTPTDADEARAALEWEEYLDAEIGVPLRLWFYHHTLPDRARALRFLLERQPWRARLMFGVAFPKVRTAMTRAMGIDAQAACRAEERLFAALDRLDAALNGREFLVGTRLSRADLTACALLLPFCRPGESTGEAAKILPQALSSARAACANRRFFAWASEICRDRALR